jgi:hypothetical protein
MADRPSAVTLGDMLDFYRRRRFAGRASEVELFRAALGSPEPLFSVLHVCGPGGVGNPMIEIIDR